MCLPLAYVIFPVSLGNWRLTSQHVGFVSGLLVRFRLANKGEVPPGWVSRLLSQCTVPYVEIWEVLHNMYESQVGAHSKLSLGQKH